MRTTKDQHKESRPAKAGIFLGQASPSTPKEGLKEHPLGRGCLLSDEVLYRSNVFITPGGIFGSAGKKYVRVSLCSTVEKILEATTRIRAKAHS